MACPDHQACSNADCIREGVCMNGDYWGLHHRKKAELKRHNEKMAKSMAYLEKVKDAVCCYCEEKIIEGRYTVEHLVPKSSGGNNRSFNLRHCCATCNKYRLSKAYPRWIRDMKARVHELSHQDEARQIYLKRISNAAYWYEYTLWAGPILYRNHDYYLKSLRVYSQEIL